MTLRTLTPIQVQNLTNKPVSKNIRKSQKGRPNGLACYVPNGEKPASRRVTGATIDPDSEEMKAAAVYFATGLHRTTIAMQGDPGEQYRSIIGPARYSDRVLETYCYLLIKGAMGPRRQISTAEATSPLIFPYLMGGIPMAEAEAQCYRALRVMDFMYEDKPPKGHETQKALTNVGFGVDVKHEPGAPLPPHTYGHLSKRQHYMISLPEGDYAKQLLKNGAFDDSMYRLLDRFKFLVIEHAEHCLDPEGGEMTPLAAKDRVNVRLTEVNYWRAVRMVFEQRWDRLDLDGEMENGVADGEVLMARNIIYRLCYNDKVTAEVLVGMSLLTGISVANWTKYAIQDHIRRGETFITAFEIERVMEIVSLSPHYRCEHQLQQDRTTLYELERGKTRWPRKLQSPSHPLWSSTGSFYLERYNADGVPIYRHKPFTLLED